MKRNPKAHIKAAAGAVAAIMILAALCACAVFASADGPGSDILIEAEAGYGTGVLHPDRCEPMTVTVDNRSKSDINGKLYVKFTDMSGWTAAETPVYTYEIPCSVAAGTKKKTSFYLNGDVTESCTVELRSSSGKLLASCKLSNSVEYGRILLGWMTDTPETAAVLTRLQDFDTGVGQVSAVPLTPDLFPDTELAIGGFDAIFVGKADLSESSRFSQKQLSALKDYVRGGGTVIVSTGDGWKDSLSLFSEFFSGTPGGSVSLESKKSFSDSYLNLGNSVTEMISFCRNPSQYAYSGSEMNFSQSDLIKLSDPNFTYTAPEDERTALLYRHKSLSLYVSNIDLNDPVLDRSKDSAAFILQMMIRAGAYDDITLSKYSSAAGTNYLGDLKNDLLPYLASSPNIFILVVALLLYTGVGLVLPFLIARKKKKPMLAWIIMPAAAVIFSTAIFIYGYFSKGGGIVANTLVTAELSPSGGTAKAVSVVKVPSGGKYKISYDREDAVYGDPFRSGDPFNFSSYTEPATISVSGKESGMIPVNASAWSNIWAGASFDTQGEYGSFDISLAPDKNSAFRLEIKNNTGKDLTDVTVYALGNTVALKELKNGEVYQTSVSVTGALFDPTDPIYELYYKPLGYDRETAEWDTGLKSYYGGYYYGYGYGYGSDGNFESLSDSKKDQNRARVIRSSGQIFGDYSYSSVIVSGFAEGTEQTLRVNRRNPLKHNCETLLWQKADFASLTAGMTIQRSGNCELMYDSSICVTTFDIPTKPHFTIGTGVYDNSVAVLSIPVGELPLSDEVEITVTVSSNAPSAPQAAVMSAIDKYPVAMTLTSSDQSPSASGESVFSAVLRLDHVAFSTNDDPYNIYNGAEIHVWGKPYGYGFYGNPSDRSVYILISFSYDEKYPVRSAEVTDVSYTITSGGR